MNNIASDFDPSTLIGLRLDWIKFAESRLLVGFAPASGFAVGPTITIGSSTVLAKPDPASDTLEKLGFPGGTTRLPALVNQIVTTAVSASNGDLTVSFETGAWLTVLGNAADEEPSSIEVDDEPVRTDL